MLKDHRFHQLMYWVKKITSFDFNLTNFFSTLKLHKCFSFHLGILQWRNFNLRMPEGLSHASMNRQLKRNSPFLWEDVRIWRQFPTCQSRRKMFLCKHLCLSQHDQKCIKILWYMWNRLMNALSRPSSIIMPFQQDQKCIKIVWSCVI